MRTLRVLIADDESWVRALLRSIVAWERLGLEIVAEATNGSQALELCAQKHPDVLITDIKMPGLDGLELIHRLRGEQPELIVIVISGHDDFSFAQQALREGVLDYALKPLNQEVMHATLRKAVDLACARSKRARESRAMERRLRVLEDAVTETCVRHVECDGVDARIVRAIDYLSEHFRENPTLLEVADFAHTNRTYFSELFKRETGRQFSYYLQQLKMLSAEELLKSTDLRISEVARACGYDDAGYFSRVFRKTHGQSPDEFRHSAE